MGTHLFGSPRM